MMTERSLFFGSYISERTLRGQVVPILIMLCVVPFIDPNGPSHHLAIVFCRVAVLAAFSLFLLYLLFELLSGKGWSRTRAVDTGKVITLWLMAGVSVAYLF
jgi:hypothetical protein